MSTKTYPGSAAFTHSHSHSHGDLTHTHSHTHLSRSDASASVPHSHPHSGYNAMESHSVPGEGIAPGDSGDAAALGSGTPSGS